jgi:gliding motility-associated-like protein
MSVIVNDNPTTPSLTSNSPVCSGTALQLTASKFTGANYSWTGPNGFTSSSQNPTISTTVLANGGTYNVSVSAPGCAGVSSASIMVAVNQTPALPQVSSNGPVCEGTALNLSASTVSGATYNWIGPNGFTSTSQNPSINNATKAAGGTYTVTLTANGCTNNPTSTNIIVKPIPSTPVAANNTPICDGGNVNLSASTVADATYNWRGPNSFTSASQNPSIVNAALVNRGTYYVTATVAGCTGFADSTIVRINENPTPPVLSSNSPVCNGDPLQLTATAIVGADYNWTGPDGFNSSLRNPSIKSTVISNAGKYSVIITAGGCPSTTSSSIIVAVNPVPNAPFASNNGPLCAGNALNLSASPVHGATYNWTGPNGFLAISQNTAINNTSIADTGLYKVTATVNGCTSAAGNTIAVVKQPAIANAGTDQIVCANNSIVNLAGTVTGGSTTGQWSTSGTGTFTAGITSLAGTYTPGNADKANGRVILGLASTNNSVCPSSISSIVVRITSAPTADAGPDQNVCSNKATVILNGQVTAASGGIWSTSGTGIFNPSKTSLNATYAPGASDIAKGKVALTLTTTDHGNCVAVADEMIVTITSPPTVKLVQQKYLLEGNTDILEPTVTGEGLNYLWSPNKYFNNNTLKNPLITGVEDITYKLKVTDIRGCVAEESLSVKVLKSLKIPNTFTPNNDGINETWIIDGLVNYPGNRVQVFNRYGQLIFESIGYAKPWDGTMNGKSLPVATYYYVIEAGNGRKPYTGYVTLVK